MRSRPRGRAARHHLPRRGPRGRARGLRDPAPAFADEATFGDFAILYRGNHQARPFEKALREHNIPYFLSGGTSFFARAEVKDVMAYLRLLANPEDDAAFLRIVNTPRREIGPNTLENLAGYARERGRAACCAPAASWVWLSTWSERHASAWSLRQPDRIPMPATPSATRWPPCAPWWRA